VPARAGPDVASSVKSNMGVIADWGLWIADWMPDLRIRNPKSAIDNQSTAIASP